MRRPSSGGALDFGRAGASGALSDAERARIREENTRALIGDTLHLRHASLLSEVYDVEALPESLTRGFVLPCAPPADRDDSTRRKTLGPRKKWDSSLFTSAGPAAGRPGAPAEPDEPYEPLVLWRPPADAPASDNWAESVTVDEILARKLRQHQREGVQFLFETLMNERAGEEGEALDAPAVRRFRPFKGQGCILADDMGLGKTLQSITILHTLLRGGFRRGEPAARKALIVCPTSLVGNWESELTKWLGHKAPHTLTLGSIEPLEAMRRVGMFRAQSRASGMVLILSYEMARKYIDELLGADVGLLICDEAHRLKNDKTATAQALDRLRTPRRVLLSGTPVQNDLDEFYAMVNFCNPGVLGDERRFGATYARPILRGREPDATEAQIGAGEARGQQLGNFCHNFILRRTNTILSAHLCARRAAPRASPRARACRPPLTPRRRAPRRAQPAQAGADRVRRALGAAAPALRPLPRLEARALPALQEQPGPSRHHFAQKAV